MPWVLDGNNLAGGSHRGPVRRAALSLARQQRVRVVVFFDGEPPSGVPGVERLGAVEVRYVRNADAAITALVAGGSGFRVATDDRALAAKLRAAGAEVVGSATFWERVSEAESRRAGESGEEKPFSLDLDAAIQRLPEAPGRVPRRRPGRRRMR